MVQCLGFHPSTAGGMGSIPGQGPKILHNAVKKKERNLSKALSDHTSSHCDSDKASLLSSVLDLEGPFWQGSKEALICGERSPF